MPAMNAPVTPPSIAPPAARYALGVVTTDATRLLHTAGVVPVRPDGSVPERIGEQAELVWANIAAILTEAGMTTTDIVSMTTYVVAGHGLAEVMAARDRFLSPHLAASTLVTVPTLARPEWLVEIAVVAAS
jgi:enamine deaminase RidA (YjgF/YER057c/UK114 family)